VAQQETTIRQVRLVGAVSHTVHLKWMKDESARAKELAPAESILYDFYITNEVGSASRKLVADADDEIQNGSDKKLSDRSITIPLRSGPFTTASRY